MHQRQQVALLINQNARRVNKHVMEQIHEWVPEHQVYATQSPEESKEAVRDILDKGYENVFAGGGDGTFVGLINSLEEIAEGRPWPRIGMLRLGTGNALAHLVSSSSPEDDLRSFLTQQQRDDMPISLLCDDDGVLSPFAGAGLDAQVLHDYNSMKDGLAGQYAGPLVKNVVGYFLAAFSRTIPRRCSQAFKGSKLSARITNTGDQAFILGENGLVQEFVDHGDVVYEGPVSLVAAGTTPYYGYGMKMLPHARKYPSMFQLRVGTANVAKSLTMLPSLWKGTYHGNSVTDFVAESVKIEFSEPTPYQVAGDAAGNRDEINLRVAPQPVNLIRLI